MRVRRMFLVFMVAVMMVAMVTIAGPVFAQGRHTSCKAFGLNIAGLARASAERLARPRPQALP